MGLYWGLPWISRKNLELAVVLGVAMLFVRALTVAWRTAPQWILELEIVLGIVFSELWGLGIVSLRCLVLGVALAVVMGFVFLALGGCLGPCPGGEPQKPHFSTS